MARDERRQTSRPCAAASAGLERRVAASWPTRLLCSIQIGTNVERVALFNICSAGLIIGRVGVATTLAVGGVGGGGVAIKLRLRHNKLDQALRR